MYYDHWDRKELADACRIWRQEPTQKQLRDVFKSAREDAENTYIRLSGLDGDGQAVHAVFQPVTRWSPAYAKRVLAKMYRIDGAIRGRDCTMITLTSRQRGKTRLAQLQELNDGRRKLIDILRHEAGKKSYFYVFEPHKTGFSHVHVLWFGLIPQRIQRKCRALWNEKYNLGGFAYALHFERSVRIENGRQYLMKYVTKTFAEEGGASGGFLDFASCVSWSSRHDTKERGVRLWGMSRDLSAICRAEPKPSSVFWLSYEIAVYEDVILAGVCDIPEQTDGEFFAEAIARAVESDIYV